MLKICVDTSFLISFADDSRPNHSTAMDYFRHCVANGHLLCLPAYDWRAALLLIQQGVTEFATVNEKDSRDCGFQRFWNPLAGG